MYSADWLDVLKVVSKVYLMVALLVGRKVDYLVERMELQMVVVTAEMLAAWLVGW